MSSVNVTPIAKTDLFGQKCAARIQKRKLYVQILMEKPLEGALSCSIWQLCRLACR